MTSILTKPVFVFGAGAFGTCLARHLALKGADVTLWARRKAQCNAILATRRNPDYLKEIQLPTEIKATSEINPRAVSEAGALVLAVPTQSLTEFLPLIKPHLRPDHLIISTAKGIELTTHRFPSQIVAHSLGEVAAHAMVTLSGPSFAIEVATDQPTGVSAASKHLPNAVLCQELFHSPLFRVYAHQDPMGLEVAGAMKNVIAIAAGGAAGLGFMANTHAVLVTRGLAEMMRLGKALGADPLTFNGLGGVGDLYLTCSSQKSRNFRLGYLLAQGASLSEVMSRPDGLSEGYSTAKAAVQLANKLGIDMPISKAVYEVLYRGKKVRTALQELVSRSSKDERL